MSMKSMMMMPPRLRRPQLAGNGHGRFQMVRKIVSSRFRWPTKPPVFPSIVAIDSV